jgi:dGTPase
MGAMYSRGDAARIATAERSNGTDSYRSPWRRDYARLIHCPSFRRLQGKTQVFPGYESDFFRNRLTHSLEVAQIAKSIAMRLNATAGEFKKNRLRPEIVEFAGLAHDLGHPPFGHTGEEALDESMREKGGFEGNAQTLRIVARLEKKSTLRLVNDDAVAFDRGEDLRCGLNLTFRSLASLLKYDYAIPTRSKDRKVKEDVSKGYYAEEKDLVAEIKRHVLGIDDLSTIDKFKTIECSIMDIADDIAYSTYDLARTI